MNILFVSLYFYFSSFIYLFFNKRNPFLILIILELQLVLLCFIFIYFSVLSFSIIGLIFAVFIIAFAGAEASVGISVLIVFYRLRGVITTDNLVSNSRI